MPMHQCVDPSIPELRNCFVLNFEFLSFDIVSDFVLWISNFQIHGCRTLNSSFQRLVSETNQSSRVPISVTLMCNRTRTGVPS